MNVISNGLIHESVRAPEALEFAVAGCDLGSVLIARSRAGVCAILMGPNAEELEAGLGQIFPGDVFIRNEHAVKEESNKILRFPILGSHRARHCPRYPWHVLPTQGLGGASHHSGG